MNEYSDHETHGCVCYTHTKMTLAMKRLHPMYEHRQLALTMMLHMEVASPCPWTLMDVLLADAGACDLDMDAGLVDLISRSIARLADGVAVTPMMVFVLADIVAHHAGRFGPDNFDALFHMLDCGKNTTDADRVERTINDLECKLIVVLVALDMMDDSECSAPVPADRLAVLELPCVVLTSECTMCKDDTDTDMGSLMPCGHVFHTACIRMWLAIANTCPMCRAELAESTTVTSPTRYSVVNLGEFICSGYVAELTIGVHVDNIYVTNRYYVTHDRRVVGEAGGAGKRSGEICDFGVYPDYLMHLPDDGAIVAVREFTDRSEVPDDLDLDFMRASHDKMHCDWFVFTMVNGRALKSDPVDVIRIQNLPCAAYTRYI